MKIAKINRSFFLHIPFQQKLNKNKNSTRVHACDYSWMVVPHFSFPAQLSSVLPPTKGPILFNTFQETEGFRLWNKSQLKQWLGCSCHFIMTILNLYHGFSCKDIHLIRYHPILDIIHLPRERISSISTELRMREAKHRKKVTRTGCQ